MTIHPLAEIRVSQPDVTLDTKRPCIHIYPIQSMLNFWFTLHDTTNSICSAWFCLGNAATIDYSESKHWVYHIQSLFLLNCIFNALLNLHMNNFTLDHSTSKYMSYSWIHLSPVTPAIFWSVFNTRNTREAH